jgi:hypothetical protein
VETAVLCPYCWTLFRFDAPPLRSVRCFLGTETRPKEFADINSEMDADGEAAGIAVMLKRPAQDLARS